MTRKNLKNLTKLEAEKQSKLIIRELEEELEATGQESDTKAVKHVQEVGKKERKEEAKELTDALTKANDVKSKLFTYRDAILQEMKRQMIDSFDVLPQHFIWYPIKDQKQGLQIWIRDPMGKWYARGMNICTIPEYDVQCVSRLIEKALNHMDDLAKKYEELKNPPEANKIIA